MIALNRVDFLMFFYFSSLIYLLGCQQERDSVEDWTPLLGNWDEFDAQLNQVSDPMTRDVLLIQLAVQNLQYSNILCQKVETHGAKEKCQKVIERPHLTAPRFQ